MNGFWNAPYGVDVTVFSRGGAQTIRLDAPVRDLAGESYDPALIKAARIVDCTELSKGFAGDPGADDLIWDVDPPPYAREIELPIPERCETEAGREPSTRR